MREISVEESKRLLEHENSSSSYGAEQDPDTNVLQTKKPSGWGARYTFVLMICFGNLITYTTRVDISVALVAMVKREGMETN